MVACCPPPPPPRANTHHVLLRLLHVLTHTTCCTIQSIPSSCSMTPRAVRLPVLPPPHPAPSTCDSPHMLSRPTCRPALRAAPYTHVLLISEHGTYIPRSPGRRGIYYTVYTVYIYREGGRTPFAVVLHLSTTSSSPSDHLDHLDHPDHPDHLEDNPIIRTSLYCWLSSRSRPFKQLKETTNIKEMTSRLSRKWRTIKPGGTLTI